MPEAFEVLAGLRLEDGRLWADAAVDQQVSDARAVFDSSVRRHFWLRPRGASKTTDAAGVALALLVAEAPARSRSYLIAVDADQAALLHDALVGFVVRTAGLPVKVEARRVSVPNGASVEVLASDAASAWGLRPWLTIVDELAVWPETGNHRRLLSALLSALPKRKDSRLLVLTTPGAPSHPAYRLWRRAEVAGQWRTSAWVGPCPWWSAADVEAARADLLPSEFARLVGCEWATGEEQLTTLADVEACVDHHGHLPAVPGRRYILSLDIGLKKDATALVVAHGERLGGGVRVVVDRVHKWRGSRLRPVDLSELEASIVELHRGYHRAALVFDPYQAALLSQRLRAAGVATHEFTFSPSNISRLARDLYTSIRDRTLGLPDDDDLIAELASVKLVERAPGLYRIDHASGAHDDQAISVGMAVTWLLAKPQSQPGRTHGRQIAAARLDPALGYASFAERRAVELEAGGVTPWS